MRRLALVLVSLIPIAVVAGFVAQKLFGDDRATPDVQVAKPAAILGAGEDAIAIGANGRAIAWFPVETETALPSLPDAALPESGRLAGPMLAQARVLGATPAALRPHVERSYYGDDGVVVVLNTGIELVFGDASQTARKWRAVAAVLADPTTVALDFVDVQAPSRPTTGGSGHLLPPPP